MSKTTEIINNLRTVSQQQRASLQQELRSALAETQQNINACLERLLTDAQSATERLRGSIMEAQQAQQDTIDQLERHKREAIEAIRRDWQELLTEGQREIAAAKIEEAKAKMLPKMLPLLVLSAAMLVIGGLLTVQGITRLGGLESQEAYIKQRSAELDQEAREADQNKIYLEGLLETVLAANIHRFAPCPSDKRALCVRIVPERIETGPNGQKYVRLETDEQKQTSDHEVK